MSEENVKRSAARAVVAWIDSYPMVAAVAFAAVVGLMAWRTLQRLDVPGKPDTTHWAMQDFRDAVYWPAVAFLDGVNPYDTPRYQAAYPVGAEFPLYSPVALLVHSPLALLPYRVAEAVYFSLSILLVPVLALAVLRWCELDVTWGRVFALAALVQLSRPAYSNLLGGQVALPMVLGCFAALHWAKSRPWLSGLGLALTSLKPTFAVPLALMMLCRRDFRAVVMGTAIGAIGAAIGAAILIVGSSGGLPEFVQSIMSSHAAFEAEIAANPIVGTMRCDALAVVARLLDWTPGPTAKLFVPLAIWALCGAAVAKLSRIQRRADDLAGTITCLVILVSVYHLAYDGLVLILPLMAIAIARRETWRSMPVAGRVAIFAAISVPCWNYLGTYEGLHWLGIEQGQGLWAAVTAINGLSLLAALVACLLGVVSRRWLVVRD